MIHNLSELVVMNDGNKIPGFGLGVFAADGEKCYDAVRYALDAGYRHIDTAEFYGNEEEVGRAIRESGVPREDIFLTTKLWPSDFIRAEEVYEKSMHKLNCEYLNLYLLHWPGTDEDLRLHVWEFVQEQVARGNIKSAGVSNFMVPHLRNLIKRTGTVPVNNQIEFHPWHQQREVCRFCNENNIVVTAWGPLFHGHLKEEPLMGEIGEKYGKSAAQATLRWALEKDVVLIPKSEKKERIIQNADIFDFALTAEDTRMIDGLEGKGFFGDNPMTFNG